MFPCLPTNLVHITFSTPSFNPFASIGLDTPPWAQWLLDNKIYACMMTFFLFNGQNDFSKNLSHPPPAVETQLISTGAFEITLNDMPVRGRSLAAWSLPDT